MRLCIKEHLTHRWITNLDTLPFDTSVQGDLYYVSDEYISEDGNIHKDPECGYFVGKVYFTKVEESCRKNFPVKLAMSGLCLNKHGTEPSKYIYIPYDVLASGFNGYNKLMQVIMKADNVEKCFYHEDEHEVWKVLEMYEKHYKAATVDPTKYRYVQLCYASSLEGNRDLCFAIVINQYASHMTRRPEN